MSRLLDYTKRRDKLRKQWKKETRADKKTILVLRGKCLNIAIERLSKKIEGGWVEKSDKGDINAFAERLFK